MYNFPVGSVDGYGDRDDIALERDRAQGIISDRYHQELMKREEDLYNSGKFGTSSTAMDLTEILAFMLENETYNVLKYCNDVKVRYDSPYEHLNEVCIRLGLSDEEISLDFNKSGDQVNISILFS